MTKKEKSFASGCSGTCGCVAARPSKEDLGLNGDLPKKTKKTKKPVKKSKKTPKEKFVNE